MSPSVADATAALAATEAGAAWLARLRTLDPVPIALPDRDALPEVLVDLAVPHVDVEPMTAARPDPLRDPGLWWVMARAVADLAAHTGTLAAPTAFPPLPPVFGTYFYAYVYLAALPYVRAFHARRGVDADVARRTLADLGRNLAVHRWQRGNAGLIAPDWPMRHFRGAIYLLGRLQFEMVRLGRRTGDAIVGGGGAYGPGTPALAVHVPGMYGPLTPSACEASFARAREFFARHFPETRFEVAVCHSWLLDPRLAEVLAADSNITAFQQRFTLAKTSPPDDDTTLRFVFGQAPGDLALLPQDTSLQRAIVAHLRDGGHWRTGSGWLVL